MSSARERIALYERRRSHRAQFDARWEQMAPFLAPSRAGILGRRTAGEPQSRGVYDSTTLMAAELLAMVVAGYIINPAQQWGTMDLPRLQGSARDSAREWLDECRDRMLRRFAASMFYAEATESMIDWCGFGTGFLVMEENPRLIHQTQQGFRGFYFDAQRTGRFVISEGPMGIVDTAQREFVMTAMQMLTRFGRQALPEKARQAIDTGKPDEEFHVIQTVQPRDLSAQRAGAGARAMPFASYWDEKDSRTQLSESGYRTFNGAVYRYSRTPGTVYGRGRGDVAWPDTATLNTAKRMGLEDWELKIRPPVLMRHDSVIGTLRLTPAGPTSVNTHGGPIQDAIMPFQTGSNPQVSALKEEELRKSIRQIFYVEHLLMLLEVRKSEMTAFEFAKKLEILFRMIGPVYGRIEHEFLRQIWDAAFDMMFWAGEFSPPPPSVFETDGNIDTTFENPLARAQRFGEVEAIAMAVQDMAGLGTLFPQMYDRLDPDKTASKILDIRGVPASITRNEQELAAVREARAEQEEAQNDLAEVSQTAEAAGKAAPFITALQGGTT